MADMSSIKEMIQCATLEIPKGMKNAISISIAFCLDFLIRNENITSEECKTINRLKLGGGGNSHRLEYGICHYLRVLFRLENKFLGLFYSL